MSAPAPPAARPAVFAIPPGEDYAARFAEGLAARLPDDRPEAAAEAVVYVNTRRALRTLEDALARRHGAKAAAILPRLAVLDEIGTDPLAAAEAEALPPAGNPLRRRLAITRLVEGWLARDGLAAPAAAPELADSLAGLIDLLDEEGVADSALDALVPDAMAEHWQKARDLLALVRARWPAIRAESEADALDPAARARAAIARQCTAWAAAPPQTPVIVAASTGSRAGAAALMAAVARLPRGALVLPGFDAEAAADIWPSVSAEHPYGPFRRLFEALGIGPADVRPWLGDAAPSPRRRLLAEALRPAPVTDAWIAGRAGIAALAAEATAGLSLIEAPHPRAEAAAIALAMREALERPGRRVALVTRDATLARRVSAELARFGVLADDSLGRPLSVSPAGSLLRLTLAAARAAGAEPVPLAALLAHPLCRAGRSRGAHLALARAYERAALRGMSGREAVAGALPPWPEESLTEAAEDARTERETWRAGIAAALDPLAHALAEGAPLIRLVTLHRDAVAALTAGPEAPALAEAGEDGAAVARLTEALSRAADAYGSAAMPGAEYAALLDDLLAAETLRPEAARPHPRVQIWGTIEARVQAADLTILGGLNDGVWPAQADPGPWLSRPMRHALGLPEPERETGLSAHDFLQAAARPEVILTRARRAEGAPTVPSRWLVRLENLLAGTEPAALAAMKARGARFLALLPALDSEGAAPDDPALRPALRPQPAPPREARPRRLSVTQIERLLRDPYAIYARTVLGLRPLDPLGPAPDPLTRGTVLHAVLQRYVEEADPEADPAAADLEAAEEQLIATAECVLQETVAAPGLRRLWRGRILRAARWFVQGEAERRAAARPAALERAGRTSLTLPGGPFAITAKADRIDLRPDGRALVYDYKSGGVPTAKQLGTFSHQLHLQALILADGGFDGLAAAETAGGAYLGLAAGGRTLAAPEDIAGELPAYRADLLALLTRYDDPATPYLSHRAPERIGDTGDYDHLARRAEWGAAGAEEG